ncbi:MAG TPA: VOC family protein [Candidatus Dormibacteraeota bacterium]|nr:VOC family protein [Candidatus Dormibacteraeota bacterium]
MNADAEKSFSLKMVAPLEPGIVCVDIDRMLDFYVRVLGLTLMSDDEATPEMSAIFGAAPHGFRIIRLQTPYGERVKLVQIRNGHATGIPAPEWVFHRQGIAYITFIVSNIDEVTERLTAQGVKLVRPEPVEVRKGFVALFVEDPEGNFVEFVEYDDISSYRRDLFKQTYVVLPSKTGQLI